MSAVDTRNLTRESLFVMAEMAVEGRGEAKRVKVRNLSDGGLMAEGELDVVQGERVVVTLTNVGAVRGAVAWTQGNRMGVAFDERIDARAARPRRATPRQTSSSQSGMRHRVSVSATTAGISARSDTLACALRRGC